MQWHVCKLLSPVNECVCVFYIIDSMNVCSRQCRLLGCLPFSLPKPVGSSPSHRQSFHVIAFISSGPGPRPTSPAASGRPSRPGGTRRQDRALEEPPEGRAAKSRSDQPGEESDYNWRERQSQERGWQVHPQGAQGAAHYWGGRGKGGAERGAQTFQKHQREVQGEKYWGQQLSRWEKRNHPVSQRLHASAY